jgi:hypothetical protein
MRPSEAEEKNHPHPPPHLVVPRLSVSVAFGREMLFGVAADMAQDDSSDPENRLPVGERRPGGEQL